MHPKLGAVTIAIAIADPDAVIFAPRVVATVNATGQVVFEWDGAENYEAFRFAGQNGANPVSNPVDGRGHVFFEWNPGRYEGVSFLAPTDSGFDSGGTLGVGYEDGFYNADVVDSDGDGNYEIDQRFVVCEPSCGDGYIYSHLWAWDGTTYSGSDTDPNLGA